uniref:NADH-ubiquinone oxidoreductase chain 6 n=1 Tax=Diaphanes pectinealis TaxID=370597 RepID=A0A5C0PY31_9COLE|nr:NADH dehydrogenase subunit 6 [Diaphanes pectinealis]QEJ81666.1 NADH dehydrogenase subunit 6 [Diaphanes pectinealis]
MEIMLWLMSISTLTFMFMEHPMSMGLILLTQTSMISITTSIMGINSWFSYILFLSMVGGMLILFMYMTSVASNELFKHSNNLFIMMLSTSLLYFMFKKEVIMNYFMFNNNDSYMLMQKNNFSIILMKYLSFPLMFIWLTLIMYLLITMIAVVKITTLKYGPLRQMN